MSFLLDLNQSTVWYFVIFRAIVLFFISVLIIRFGNHRLNLKTPLDFLLIIIYGSLVSRGINGSATLVSTFLASLTMVVCHKFMAKMTFLYPFIGYLFKGNKHYLIKNGIIQTDVLRKLNISKEDIMGQLRCQLHHNNIQEVKYATLERTGNISFYSENEG